MDKDDAGCRRWQGMLDSGVSRPNACATKKNRPIQRTLPAGARSAISWSAFDSRILQANVVGAELLGMPRANPVGGTASATSSRRVPGATISTASSAARSTAARRAEQLPR
jgi:hypothetical protein